MSFQPTVEQQSALAAFNTGRSLRITALAGTGKTSTLQYLAEQNPTRRILYIAFNKSVQMEAADRFPRNVTAKTAHSLAYRDYGRPLAGRLRGRRIPTWEAATILGQTDALPLGPLPEGQTDGPASGVTAKPAALAALALGTVRTFMRSADNEILPEHVGIPAGWQGRDGVKKVADTVHRLACRAWDDMRSPDGQLRCEHDVYLKLWAMARPQLRGFDVVMVDEAQDTDPCLAQVIAAQRGRQIVVVGDDNQAIYGWRGATDFMSRFDAEHTVALTTSFRFGPAVADEANVWLQLLRSRLRVSAAGGLTSTVYGRPGDNRAAPPPDAILCRSNGGAMSAVLHSLNLGRRPALVGGAADLDRFCEAADRLINGGTTQHPDLAGFETWDQVVDYADSDEGTDLAVWVNLIDTYGVPQLRGAIARCVDEKQADVTVSTMHKAKGRQWPRVEIWDDFREPKPDPDTGEAGLVPREEAMLAYVAVTRAQQTLDVNGLAWIHDGHN